MKLPMAKNTVVGAGSQSPEGEAIAAGFEIEEWRERQKSIKPNFPGDTYPHEAMQKIHEADEANYPGRAYYERE